ncbi:hypothetical protein [Pandoraea sputorum]|uniref:Uncharacterized protein n=1 Tax=Pandoraea sputorum TaxID=93222 RepID=A0A5E5BLG9_9BURK|nr:hypothetical protein [Pandoraea sputorum]VVE85353.1 hypothetical protein PSP31121_05191 [Pandoraea sputorum]
MSIYPSKGLKIPNCATTTWGARTYSGKNSRRTDSKVRQFDTVTPDQKLAHLKRLKAGLEGFYAANVNKSMRADHLHNVYRAKNSYFNDEVADAFKEKETEGGLNLNFGHRDNAYFTRTNDDAFSTVLLRMRDYANQITDEKSQEKLAQAGGVPPGARSAILEECKDIQELIGKMIREDQIVSFGWAPVNSDEENMDAGRQYHWGHRAAGPVSLMVRGQPSWSAFDMQQQTAYDEGAKFFNEIKKSIISDKVKYQFFSDVLSFLQNKEEVELKWPRIEDTHQELQEKFEVRKEYFNKIKSSPDLSKFFCQNAERAFDVSVKYNGVKEKFDTQRAVATLPGVTCADKDNVTITTFTDHLPAVAAGASRPSPKLTPLQLRINVDITGLEGTAGASALEMRKFFIELSKKIHRDLKSVVSIEIDNDVLQGTWPSINLSQFFITNQIGISFKADVPAEEIKVVAGKLDDFTKEFFKSKYVPTDNGSAKEVSGCDYVTQLDTSRLVVNENMKHGFKRNTPGFREFQPV